MTIYQIFVDGCSAVFGSPFRMHSKDVFTAPPSEDDIENFIDRCCDKSFIDYLDKNEPYKTKALKLNLIDNKK